MKKNLKKNNLKNNKLIFRKLKISDFKQFNYLFNLCFKKKVSFEFYRWRYFKDKNSFCYGIFNSSKLVANVGMKSIRLNNSKREMIFSRHSSMVHKTYRGKGIFTHLLKVVKQKFLKDTKYILMWPNKYNFSTFGIPRKKILKKKFYLYKYCKIQSNIKITSNYKLSKINKFIKLINNNNSFYFKDVTYFKRRYFDYKSHEYLINKFKFKKSVSFFILKKYRDKKNFNYFVLDHFGNVSIKFKHYDQLMKDYGKITFWSIAKKNKPNLKLINCINLHIGIAKNIHKKIQNSILLNKEFMPGDTDSFITLK